MKKSNRIIIADDHDIFREGLKQVLGEAENLEIVAEAGDGNQAVELTDRHKPDLVIMDIAMPGLSGIEATRKITALSPAPKVIILSVYSRRTYITESMKAGARGYVLKDSTSEKLLDAIEAVDAGGYYLDTPAAGHIVGEFIKMSTEGGSSPEADALTDREREVLSLIVEGKTTKEIADKLYISIKTVENHRSNLKNKLGRHSVVDLIKYAISTGLVDPNTWSR